MCPEFFNVVNGPVRHKTVPREAHVHALMTLIKYAASTENRGLILSLSSNERWSREHKFNIHGCC